MFVGDSSRLAGSEHDDWLTGRLVFLDGHADGRADFQVVELDAADGP